ncbi:MAG TPA: hypothetical protein VK772_09250 [Puia sp.]|nr:hypothetical protein [Puia sp.]
MKNRPERLISFLVVWLTMFSFNQVLGQNSLKKDFRTDFRHLCLPGGNSMLSGSADKDSVVNGRPDGPQGAIFTTIMASGMEYAIPSNIYYIQSGFFCKREWELEKTTHIPFRIRLGSLADCNALEGKH